MTGARMADDKERLILHRLRPDKSEDDAEHLEIPAFLRRQTGETDAAFEALTAQAHAVADEIFRGDRERYTDHSEKDAVGSGSESKSRDEQEAPMSDSVSHSELDAKLETAAARMDLRLAQFDSDMRGIVADLRQETRELVAEMRQDRSEVVGGMRQEISDFRLEIQPLKNMKASIWGSTAVIVGAIFAAVALAFGAFDSGRDTSQALQEMRQQSFETRQLLEQVKAQQAAQPVPQVPPPAAPAPQQ